MDKITVLFGIMQVYFIFSYFKPLTFKRNLNLKFVDEKTAVHRIIQTPVLQKKLQFLFFSNKFNPIFKLRLGNIGS